MENSTTVALANGNIAESCPGAPVIGWVSGDAPHVAWDAPEAVELLRDITRSLWVSERDGRMGLVSGDHALTRDETETSVRGYGAPSRLEALGDASFQRDHGVRYAYCSGAMANGIASVDLVCALSEAGMLSFFGAAGLDLGTIEGAIVALERRLGNKPFGFNLIHSPQEPEHEAATVDLYLRRGVRLVEAAAYLALTLPLVKYRVSGIYRDEDGKIAAPNRVVGKVSREEVAAHFFSPPPAEMLAKLVASGDITQAQAEMAREIPMAQDITAEADSGGHTDNRPAVALLPTMIALRDRMQSEHGYNEPLRVGLAGGIGTPEAVAAAFAMGAAYVVTGSVNQACVESGSCDAVRQMLAETRQADVAMAPAADMFEMGVTVQVLKRGTMFSMRGDKLYGLYRQYKSLEEIPGPERMKLEKMIFQAPLAAIWEQTKQFFLERNPEEVARAETDAHHKMALVFRWYLGKASQWANAGVPERKMDYQVWCGPAMGAFNEWVRGSFLEAPTRRQAAVVGLNLLHGAAVLARCAGLRNQGFPVPEAAWRVRPIEGDAIKELMR